MICTVCGEHILPGEVTFLGNHFNLAVCLTAIKRQADKQDTKIHRLTEEIKALRHYIETAKSQ